MLNHLQTVLLNERPAVATSGFPFLIDPSFYPVSIPESLATVYYAIVPKSPGASQSIVDVADHVARVCNFVASPEFYSFLSPLKSIETYGVGVQTIYGLYANRSDLTFDVSKIISAITAHTSVFASVSNVTFDPVVKSLYDIFIESHDMSARLRAVITALVYQLTVINKSIRIR